MKLYELIITDGTHDIINQKNCYGVARRLIEEVISYRHDDPYKELEYGFLDGSYDYQYDRNAIYYSAVGNQRKLVDYFLAKADPAYLYRSFEEGIHGAAYGGHVELFCYIVDLEKKYENDGKYWMLAEDAYYYAVMGGSLEMIKWFVDNNEYYTDEGLECAAQYDNLHIIEYLITLPVRNRDTECDDIDWNTPMYEAARAANIEIVKYCVEKGARDWNYGIKPAIENKHMNIIDFFIDKGACDWASYIETAERCKHSDIVEFFRSYITK